MHATVAIMQPYVFPYIGYFCLVDACDTFVFYDDVNFIQKGWINRNRIAINGAPYQFTIPLGNRSQNELICNIRTHDFTVFRQKFLRQVEQAYKKAPFFDQGMHYVQTSLSGDGVFMADLAIQSVTSLCHLLGLNKTFLRSSEHFAHTRPLSRAQRLIEITRQLDADRYVNAIGGQTLYDKATFAQHGVSLSFVEPHCPSYAQTGADEHLANLSIIDVLMHNAPNVVLDMIQSYKLS